MPAGGDALRVPTGTVTLLFTDIEGSTKLVAKLRDAYGELQADHQRLLREAFRAWDGHEVDTQGDAFFVAFRRARDAVSAAVATQRALSGHAWPGGVQVRVRIGIHTDEPGVAVDRYHGLGVVRAARICAAGHGGQILLSAATRSLIDEDELPGVELVDLGEHRLKGLPRAERIFQLVAPGLSREFPPLKTLDEGPLPVTGRADELADAARDAVEEKAPRGVSRRRLLAVTAAVIPAVGAAIAYVVFGMAGSAPLTAAPNSLAVIDASSGRVTHVLPVGDTPTSIAVGGGAVWVLNANAGSVSKIDARTRAVEATFPVGAAPIDLAVASGRLWVTTAAFRVLKVDPSTKIAVPISLPASRNPAQGGSAAWVAAGGGDVWATGNAAALRLTPSRIAVSFTNVNCCGGVAIGGDRVWLADETGVLVLDAGSGHVVRRIGLPFAGGRVAFGSPYVWVVDSQGGKVWAIDVKTETLAGSVSVGAQPNGVAVGASAVWVSSGDGTVSKIDPTALKVVKQIAVGGTPAGIAAGDGAVWVAVD